MPQGHQQQQQQLQSANGSAIGDERTPLLGSVGAQPQQQQQQQQHERRKLWGEDDERPWVKWPKQVADMTWLTLSSNYVNALLVFVPLGVIAGAMKWKPSVVFILNFFATMPLAALLSFTTEELSARLGQTLGGLINATFGNAVELIVSIVALKNGEIRIIQASMLGSILSNILLILGCCFLAGGIRYQEQIFNSTVASTMSSLMAVASASLIIPAALYPALKGSKDSSDDIILTLSHGTAIILLLLYVLYLYFQLKTHANLFDEEQQQFGSSEEGEGEGEGGREAREEGQTLTPIPAGIALVIVTVIVAVCAEYLVDSIDAIVQTAHISKTFIGLVPLPIVGNAAEHATACTVAYKDKMDLAINVAIGSSIQIALFMTPFLVILGWIIDQKMTLHFQGFETVVFFLSVLVVNYLIQDGKSNYLEALCVWGLELTCWVSRYIIIALAFYVYPDDATGNVGEFIKPIFGLPR